MEAATISVDLTEDEALIVCLLAVLGTCTLSRDAHGAATLMQEIMDETTPGPDEARRGIEKLSAALNVAGRGIITLLPKTGEVS